MNPGRSAAVARSRRYVLAAAGPILVSVAHFGVSFSMLRLEDPRSFGTFTILFAAAMFSGSLSSALFGAPVQTLPDEGPQARAEAIDGISSAAVTAATIAFPAFAMLALGLKIEITAAACYGAFVALTILRQYGRAWTYSVDQARRVAASDACYGLVLLVALAIAVVALDIRPLHAVFGALAMAALASVMGLRRGYRRLLSRARPERLWRFGRTWSSQSRWSLMAVAAAEAAANAHIYLLTAFVGAAAVAPIAAAALLVRPIIVVQGALIEYERPRFVRHVLAGQWAELARTITWMRVALFLVWGGTVLVGAAILLFAPGLVFPADYDLGTVQLAAILWALLQFVILSLIPEIVLMQSVNQYAFLARVNVLAGALNLGGVIVAILAGLPVWTIAALIPGWIIAMVLIRIRSSSIRGGSFQQGQP